MTTKAILAARKYDRATAKAFAEFNRVNDEHTELMHDYAEAAVDGKERKAISKALDKASVKLEKAHKALQKLLK